MPHAWAFTLAVAAVMSAVALWAMPSSIQPGDAGEMATVMLRGGVPHPSGYPWMRILGAPARLLEAWGLSPVRAAALPCAGLAVVGWILVHRVALRFAPPWVATFSVLLLAVAPIPVLHAFDVEVWGPLLAFAGVFMFFATGPRRSPWVLGLLLGAVVSHHLTGILLLPLAIGAAAPPRGAPLRAWLRAGVSGCLGACIGLTPIVTLMWGDGDAWRWGDTRSLSGLLHHVTRADYGVLSLSLHTEAVPKLALLERAAGSVGRTLSAGLVTSEILGGLLFVCVLILGARQRPAATSTASLFGLGASLLATLVLFPLAHNIDPRASHGAWIVERFDLLGFALLAPWLAGVLARIPVSVGDDRFRRYGLAVVTALLLVRQGLSTTWHGVPSDNDIVERYAADVVRTPAPGRRAIIFGTDDHRTFPILFVQRVLGIAPEVLYIDASLLAHPWYRADLERRFPGLPDRSKPVQLIQALWADPAFADVEIYVANLFSRPIRTLPLAPQGILWRVLRPDEDASPLDVLPAHRAALARYVRQPGRGAMPQDMVAVAAHPFAADLLAIYPERTAELAGALRATGHPQEADALLTEAVLGPASGDPLRPLRPADGHRVDPEAR